jgi:uncharacterized protein YqhQ
MQLQRLTAKEPDDSMLEVAIQAIRHGGPAFEAILRGSEEAEEEPFAAAEAETGEQRENAAEEERRAVPFA